MKKHSLLIIVFVSSFFLFNACTAEYLDETQELLETDAQLNTSKQADLYEPLWVSHLEKKAKDEASKGAGDGTGKGAGDGTGKPD